MKKRFLAAALAAVLVLTIPVMAAAGGKAERTAEYQGQFSDLAEDSVFYDNVSALYEYGLSIGKVDGTFGLQDPVTVGQAVIFAGRLRSLWNTGDAERGAAAYAAPEQAAYQPYLAYLQAEGVVQGELEGRYFTRATRAQVAHILAHALPEGALPDRNGEKVRLGVLSGEYLRDVGQDTPYGEDICALYAWGIAVGSDARGTFHPQDDITRGALAALLTRMLDPALRLTLEWDPPLWKSARGATLEGLIVPPQQTADGPRTEEEMDGCIRKMLARGERQLTLHYPRKLQRAEAEDVMHSALRIVKGYSEQSYNRVQCTYDRQGAVHLSFSAETEGRDLSVCREETLAAAIEVHDALWAQGVLHYGMTDREIAYVYYEWLCRSCTYDYSAGARSVSHLPYSALCLGRAVCDGYTGAYNLFLKLEGIPCGGLANQEHIWTVAILDGVEVHIDPTWGDGGLVPKDRYFAMTPAQSWQVHSW